MVLRASTGVWSGAMPISVPVVIPDERDSADAGGAETNSSGGALGVVSGKNINKRKKRWSNQ